MQNKAALNSRLEKLERDLISPLQTRIDRLSNADRATYEDWVRRCDEHFKLHESEPGQYFANWLDGKTDRPKLPWHVERQLFDPLPEITADMGMVELAAIYEGMKGRK